MPVNESAWEDLTAGLSLPRPAQVYDAVGCLECRQTGYLGRSGVYEIMTMSPGLRRLLNSQVDIAALRSAAQREGMRPLRLAGCHKVVAGVTTIGEVLSLTPSPHNAE